MQYVAILVGCNVIVKMPLKKNLSKRWDYVGGMLIAEEEGCKVTDLHTWRMLLTAHCGKKTMIS